MIEIFTNFSFSLKQKNDTCRISQLMIINTYMGFVIFYFVWLNLVERVSSQFEVKKVFQNFRINLKP